MQSEKNESDVDVIAVEDLVLPIYLNQRIVFDLLAIFEDGISSIRSIEQTVKDQKSFEGQGDGGLALPSLFSLLSVGLSAKFRRQKDISKSKTVTEEKVHTPSSLFSKLFLLLREKGFVKRVDSRDDLSSVSTGDFVLTKATLRKNPLPDFFSSIVNFGELIQGLENNGLNSGRRNQQRSETGKVVGQIKALGASLSRGNTLDLIGSIVEDPEVKIVLPTYLDYYNHQSVSEALDSDFLVLGKVIRVVDDEKSAGINLLRNTALSMMKAQAMVGALQAKLSASGQFNVQDMVDEINAPAIQILPIAVFV